MDAVAPAVVFRGAVLIFGAMIWMGMFVRAFRAYRDRDRAQFWYATGSTIGVGILCFILISHFKQPYISGWSPACIAVFICLLFGEHFRKAVPHSD
jgi:hypothetical protein